MQVIPWAPSGYIVRWYTATNLIYNRWILVNYYMNSVFGSTFYYNGVSVQLRYCNNRCNRNNMAVLIENPTIEGWIDPSVEQDDHRRCLE